ncbi:LTA synthase family protein [Natranaerofaba carboxydovora]|uniref:LTA synthase family protein n=1 Tax=Natranaerofaba carboxydovora TaxID=2742683 RepID=UPI001F12A55A|nr:LTA synthase family protein [Natranaerofaba carboxydovora]UMZ74187.1 Lipoteichoic acid synthase 2 [Natranaerofaba carboxydovora]
MRDYYNRIKKYFINKPYSNENLVKSLVTLSFIKIVLFSIGIQAPEVELNWRILTVVVFVVANLSILLVLYSPIFFIKRRYYQIIYGLIINFGMSFVIVANRVYNMFFHSYISLQTVAHSTEGLSMFQAVYSTFRMGEFLWIIDIPILFYIFSRQPITNELIGKSTKADYEVVNGDEKRNEKKFSRFMIAALIVSITVIIWTPVLSIYTGVSEQHPHIQLRDSGPFMFYTREAVARTPVVEESRLDIRDKQRIEGWFENNKPEKKEEELEFYGEMEGKNLILLQIEALQNVAIDKEINGQEITPNLNRIIDESMFFSKTYDQTDMATADAEALVNFSLYPPGNVSAYMQYPDNYFYSLPRVLQRVGYNTSVLHGYYREFYNREEAYPNVGYESFVSMENFEKDEMYNGLLGDKTFLEQSVDHIKNLEEPYFAFVITLTSHHPFNYIEPEDYEGIDVSGYENTIVGDYIRSIHYTDAAIGRFYELLKENEILDNTLLAFYGDHAAFNYNERHYQELNQFFGVNVHKPEEQITIHKVPFGIYDQDGRFEGEIDEKMGMIDIFPTIANIMGVDHSYTMGRDVLNSEEDFVIFRDGSFIKDGKYYISKKNAFFDMNTTDQVEVENKDEWQAKVEDALEISDLIYETNYFETDFFRENHVIYKE